MPSHHLNGYGQDSRRRLRLYLFASGAGILVLLVGVLLWGTSNPAPKVVLSAPVVAPAPTPPVAAPAPTETVAPADTIENPPTRPPERPPGQPQPKQHPSTVVPQVTRKSAETVDSPEQPAESQEISPTSRRKLVRPIDRHNPFAE
jgi:hypothetical protein